MAALSPPTGVDGQKGEPTKLIFAMKLGAKSRLVEKKISQPISNESAKAKNRHMMGEEDDNEDEKSEHIELVTGFENNIIQSLTPKKEPKALIIPSQPNRDWRAVANKRRGIYLPEQEHSEPMVAQPEVLGTSTMNYGLQLPSKKIKIETSDIPIEEVDIKTEDSSQLPNVITEVKQEAEFDDDKALVYKAVEALVSEASNGSELSKPKSTLVIPNHSISKLETEAFREDMENLPDEATLEDYENIPVEEFGTALLRGMGWKEGDSIGRNKNAIAKPIEFTQRPALLGLGAKPEPLSNTRHGKHQFFSKKAGFEFTERNIAVERRRGYDSDGGKSSNGRHSDRDRSHGREREKNHIRDGDKEARNNGESRHDSRRRRQSRSRSRSRSLERYKYKKDSSMTKSSGYRSREDQNRHVRSRSRERTSSHQSRR